MSVVIDPDLAEALWPAQSPLGRRFQLKAKNPPGGRWQDPWLTVVGVAGEVKMMGPDDRNAPYVIYYSSRQQEPWVFRSLAVRYAGDPAAVPDLIRDAVRRIDPEQPIASIEPASSYYAGALEQQRFVLTLVGVFTMLAVVLAAIGVYGVVSYLVAQRTREIGLRIALGAAPRGIMRVVLRGGISMAVVGGAIGLAGALALSRFLNGMLYGVKATDLPTLLLVGGVLTAVAGGATLVPALRAARTSPLEAMRTQ
jgi:ABC-type antimicrobial peptide transport system permease subunit